MGVLPTGLVTVVSVQWLGSEAVELTYKDASGKVANELLYRHDTSRDWRSSSRAGLGASTVTVSDAMAHAPAPTRSLWASEEPVRCARADIDRWRDDVDWLKNPTEVFTVLKRIVTGIVVAVVLTGVAAAGPREDGKTAYERGDYEMALRFWRVAAEQGDATSQALLGMMYHEGEVPQDYDEAAKW